MTINEIDRKFVTEKYDIAKEANEIKMFENLGTFDAIEPLYGFNPIKFNTSDVSLALKTFHEKIVKTSDVMVKEYTKKDIDPKDVEVSFQLRDNYRYTVSVRYYSSRMEHEHETITRLLHKEKQIRLKILNTEQAKAKKDKEDKEYAEYKRLKRKFEDD